VSGHRCAVLGSPVGHSLSPALHRAAYAELGLDWRYDAVEMTEEGLPGFLAGLDEDWRGLSLTMPLKRTALRLAATSSAVAVAAGAANTLVRRDDGGWSADNTDVPGLVAALRERWSAPVSSATVLGGGATAASAVVALASLGCREVRLAVRSADRARETLEVAGRLAEPMSVETVPLGSPAIGDLVVSTIPVAAQTDEVVRACAGVPVLFDVVYDPWPTPLSGVDGAVVVGGLDLLVHQAALQLTAFTGLPAPLAAMRRAGEQALASRAAG
jgi:shikimate dehydrogenase